MHFRVTSRYAGVSAAVALSVVTMTGLAAAQVQQQNPPYPSTSPPSAKPSAPAASPAEKRAAEVEGSVKKVDPGAQTVEVSSGIFGIMGRTLEVNDRTTIQMNGRQATLADITEGAKVKAVYEARDGKNVATMIEVLPADASKDRAGSDTPRARPSAAPPTGSTKQ
jgi:Cu/Ag efflux protein CusF